MNPFLYIRRLDHSRLHEESSYLTSIDHCMIPGPDPIKMILASTVDKPKF